MGKHVDLTGNKYGRLTVVRKAKPHTEERGWLVRCDCGTEKFMKKDCFTGGTKSCGCWYKEFNANKSVTGCNNYQKRRIPGGTGYRTHLPEYSVWRGMKQRCFNPNNEAYLNYGGRGITICERWLTFENFYADMGSRPSSEHEIERKDNSKGYEVGNCIWVHGKYQARNTRKNPIREYLGVRMNTSDWADFFGVRPKILYQQIHRVGLDEAFRRHVEAKAVFVASVNP